MLAAIRERTIRKKITALKKKRKGQKREKEAKKKKINE